MKNSIDEESRKLLEELGKVVLPRGPRATGVPPFGVCEKCGGYLEPSSGGMVVYVCSLCGHSQGRGPVFKMTR